MAYVMRSTGILLLVGVAATLGGCHGSSEQKSHDAAKAAATAQAKLDLSSRELARGDLRAAARAMVESQEADERAARATSDAARAVERERTHYRAVLTQEITWVDRRIVELERDSLEARGDAVARSRRDLAISRAWRTRLVQDRDALEGPHEGVVWTILKKWIDRDLEEDRPPSIPHTYEKMYGI
jgi:hypothetical protein